MTNGRDIGPKPPHPLLPHQEDLVATVRAADRPARILLSSPPGYGKATAIAAATRAVLDGLPCQGRALVLGPAGLMAQWQSRLCEDWFGSAVLMDGPTLRRLEAETPADRSPWEEHDCVVASIDFLKRERTREDAALASRWDVVVIDEVHLCSDRSDRGRLARRIWMDRSVPVALACTATPDEPE